MSAPNSKTGTRLKTICDCDPEAYTRLKALFDKGTTPVEELLALLGVPKSPPATKEEGARS